jgi:hypothetical protein
MRRVAHAYAVHTQCKLLYMNPCIHRTHQLGSRQKMHCGTAGSAGSRCIADRETLYLREQFMSFRCLYLPSSLKLVLLISIPTSFILPAHSQTLASTSLPDAPTPQVNNEVAQDAHAQSGLQADPNSADFEHAPPADPSRFWRATDSGGASTSSGTGTENESVWKAEG